MLILHIPDHNTPGDDFCFFPECPMKTSAVCDNDVGKFKGCGVKMCDDHCFKIFNNAGGTNRIYSEHLRSIRYQSCIICRKKLQREV